MCLQYLLFNSNTIKFLTRQYNLHEKLGRWQQLIITFVIAQILLKMEMRPNFPALSTLRRNKPQFHQTQSSLLVSRKVQLRELTQSTLATNSLQSSQSTTFKCSGRQESTSSKQNTGDQKQEQHVGSMLQTMAETLRYGSHELAQTTMSSYKYKRHFYFKGLNRIIKYPHLSIPDFVKEAFEKQKIKRAKPSFKQGYLKHAGCIYYCIQNQLILIRTIDVLRKSENPNWELPYQKISIRDRISNILQIKGKNVIFPDHHHLVLLVHPWEIQFWAWALPIAHNDDDCDNQEFKGYSLRRLKLIYRLVVEDVQEIDYTADGRILYFDKQGVLHEIYPSEKKRYMFYNTGQYTLKNKMNSSSNKLEMSMKKEGSIEIVKSIMRGINKFTKSFFPSLIETMNLFCDRRRGLLFGLLRKTTKALFHTERTKYIVCYDLSTMNSKLLHHISQEALYHRFGSHIPFETEKAFKVHCIESVCRSGKANLCVVTEAGSRIELYISENDCQFEQIIRPPDFRMFKQESKMGSHYSVNDLLQQYPPSQSKHPSMIHSFSDEHINIEIACMPDREMGSNKRFAYLTCSSAIPSGSLDENQMVDELSLEVCHGDLHFDLKIDSVSESTVAANYIQHNALMHIQQELTNNSSTRHQKLKQDLSNQSFKQTLLPPSLFLIRSDSCLQYIVRLRAIDVLFTAAWIKVRRLNHNSSHLGSVSTIVKLEQLLTILFIDNEPLNLKNIFSLSLLGENHVGSYNKRIESQRRKQVCCMLVQILVDKEGKYYFCARTAAQIMELEKQFIINKARKEEEKNENRRGRQSYQSERSWNEKENELRKSYYRNDSYRNKDYNRIFQFEEFSQEMLTSIKNSWKVLLEPNSKEEQHSSKNEKSSFSDLTLDIEYQQFINDGSQSILEYVSRILHLVWSEKVEKIFAQDNQAFRNFIMRKIKNVKDFINPQKYQNELYSQTKSKYRLNQTVFLDSQNYHYLDKLFSKIQELLHFLEELSFLPPLTFHECLQKQNQKMFDELVFRSIEKELKPIVIHKWRQLFPNFISEKLVCVIVLYGQMEEVEGKQEVLGALKKQGIVGELPTYIQEYLIKRRGIEERQVKQFLRENTYKKRILRKENFLEEQSSQFQASEVVKQILLAKEEKDLGDREFDLLIGELLKGSQAHSSESEESRMMTIKQRFFLCSHISRNVKKLRKGRKASQTENHFDEVGKCISLQYQVNKFYHKMVMEENERRENQSKLNLIQKVVFNVKKKLRRSEESVKERIEGSMETQHLLTYTVLTDRTLLKDLVWATGNLLLMSYYCAFFHDMDNFLLILNDIYDTKQDSNSMEQRQYYKGLFFDLAIKSQHSPSLLRIICNLMDEKRACDADMSKKIEKWLAFQKLDKFSEQQIWVPLILLEVGYQPEDLYSIYSQQMSQVFHKMSYLNLQSIFCLKFLNCCMLAKKSHSKVKKELLSSFEVYLQSLRRSERVKEETCLGLRRMMEDL